ncbi:SusC/RagA family TonB-linked outer membrane protein [Lunatibacter salilacus]|uniref:SusC/RagA family TonB-linked outer membrane protein n=1 Tax=Lunatibacter salilacus TaxID=2483804 RepID=UPI00131DB801|nr:TonB-dependent receptor [Lunatibacter salilacus]
MKKIILRQLVMLSKRLLYGFLIQLFFCTLLLANTGNAQRKTLEEVKISVNLTDKSLSQFFRLVESKTDFKFTFNDGLVNLSQKVTLTENNISLYRILENISHQAFLNFVQVNNNIHVRNREGTERISSVEVVKVQDITITGRVVDGNGEPLPGVTIAVPGTTTGTATDLDGTYSLTVPEGSILVFSFIGFESKRIEIGQQNVIDVVLTEDMSSLQEVVVTGFGTQRKENLTGAVSSVGKEVLESRPITNIGQGLQGQISNLNITQNTGTPGGGASFNVRGFTSINGGSPLILVNNVPMDVNLINPNDVESISVLKDAASAAIYGARAAYGVILITTKSGSTSPKPTISLSFNSAINTPVVRFETEDALERMNYMNTANIARNGVPYYQFTDIYQERIRNHYNDPSQPSAFPDPQNPNQWLMSGNTDWPRELLRDSYPMSQYTASISGGDERFDYYTSLNYLYQEGINRQFDEKYKRYNFMTNLNYKITDWAKIGTKISMNNSNHIFPPNNSANHHPEGNSPFQWHQWANWPVYFPDGNYASAGSVPNMVQFYREAGHRKRDIYDTWLTGSIQLTPINNMTFNFEYTSNIKNTQEEEYWRRLPMYFVDGGISGYFPYTNPSQVTKRNFNDRYYVINAYADYANSFGKHDIKIMAGFNQENLDSRFFNSKRENLTVESIPFMNLAYGERFVGDGASEYAIRGVFTRFNYSYEDRYLLEFNGRYDGSSKFPKDDRFAFFPSLSLGWRIDNEAFFGNLERTFDMLKIRASYGNLGNQNVPGNYPYIATFASNTVNYLLNDDRPLTVLAPGLVSPTLTWETVTQRNLGLDFTMFENRLNTSFDIYRRDTKNMLTRSQTLPAVLAENEPRENAADLKTTGWDLTVGWRQQSNDLRWGVTLILSDYTAEITRFSNPVGLISDYYVGQQIGEIWGYTTTGIAQTDDEAKALDHRNLVAFERKAGDLLFADLDGDGRITPGNGTLDNPGDRSIIGNNTPRYSYGFKSDFQWKNFDLDIFFQGVAKRDLWLSNNFWLAGYNNEWNARNKVLTDWWSPENTDAYFPRPMITGGSDVTAVQTRFLQNAAYLRLKQLTIGYTIPEVISQRIKMNMVRVYLSGNNVWEVTGIYKYKNVSDPEMNGAQFYPIYRSFSLGANINF